MGVWNIDTPADTDPRSQGDDRIRELKAGLQDAFRGGFGVDEGDEAIFPGPNPSTDPIFRLRGLKGTTLMRPAAGYNGLYFDEDRQSLQRDNGTTWDDIGTNFPVNTKTMFIDPAVPVGWTKDSTHNGKAPRISSGSGGGSGGSFDPGVEITLVHSHAVSAHVHDTPIAYQAGQFYVAAGDFGTDNVSATWKPFTPGAPATATRPALRTKTAGATTDSKLANVSLAYVNVLIGIKD